LDELSPSALPLPGKRSSDKKSPTSRSERLKHKQELDCFIECLDVALQYTKVMVVKLTAVELSHVMRIATRCRDPKQCNAVFKESFQVGLYPHIHTHIRTHKTF
jgi:hypothetical protein